MRLNNLIKEFAKTVAAAYVAWIDESGIDRVIVGGVLICLIMTNIVLLHELFTEPELSVLVIDLGVFGETNVFSIMVWIVAFYIIRPVKVFFRARDESREQVDASFGDKVIDR